MIYCSSIIPKTGRVKANSGIHVSRYFFIVFESWPYLRAQFFSSYYSLPVFSFFYRFFFSAIACVDLAINFSKNTPKIITKYLISHFTRSYILFTSIFFYSRSFWSILRVFVVVVFPFYSSLSYFLTYFVVVIYMAIKVYYNHSIIMVN